MTTTTCRVFAAPWIVFACLTACGQETPPAGDKVDASDQAESDSAVGDSAEIEATRKAYVKAFNSSSLEEVVAHWSPEGAYTSRTSGDRAVGRDVLKQRFAAIFTKENPPKLATTIDSIQFVSPNVAVERGVATITRGDDDVAESSYNVVYIKRDGVWLIDRLTEEELVATPSHYDHLKELEWLIGSWTDTGNDVKISLECNWTHNQNFIWRRYSVRREGEEVESSGLQIIGWDPNQKQIRSWLFDSDGGFVTGVWTKRDDQWLVQSVVTLTGGGSGSFTSVYRPQSDGNYSWQKTNQVVEGKILPNLDEIVVQREAP